MEDALFSSLRGILELSAYYTKLPRVLIIVMQSILSVIGNDAWNRCPEFISAWSKG